MSQLFRIDASWLKGFVAHKDHALPAPAQLCDAHYRSWQGFFSQINRAIQVENKTFYILAYPFIRSHECKLYFLSTVLPPILGVRV